MVTVPFLERQAQKPYTNNKLRFIASRKVEKSTLRNNVESIHANVLENKHSILMDISL